MGHDAGHLIFWKPRAADLGEPAAVLRSLEESRLPEVLDDLDLEEVLSALKQTYRSFKPPSPVELDFPKQETAITITWSAKHFSFFFEGDAFKQMDRVSLLMSTLGLACYDALGSKQYPPDAPPRFIGTAEQEARFRIYWRIMFARKHAIMAAMGYPVDKKSGLSSALRELYRTDKPRAIEVERQANAKFDQECRKHKWYREEVEQQLDLWRKRTAKREASQKKQSSGPSAAEEPNAAMDRPRVEPFGNIETSRRGAGRL